MDRPFQSDSSDEPYVFICYSHEDGSDVEAEIRWLRSAGINVWYDEGISPGLEWSEVLANAIQRCALFLYFVSPRSVVSEHCRRELNFAQEERCSIVAVHLEATEVPAGLRLYLNNRQAILKYRLSETAYRTRLRTLLLDPSPRHAAAPQEAGGRSGSRRRPVLPVAVLLGLAVLVVVLSRLLPSPEAPESVATGKRAIAVLPFANLSPDPAHAYFAAGIHEEVLNRLARIDDLRVLSRTSVRPYAEPVRGLGEVARELRVDLVMEGSVRFADERVRVGVQLVRAPADDLLFSEVYERSFADIFAVQDDIARQVVEALALTLRQQADPARARNPEAYAAYLMGLAEFRQFTPPGWFAAIEHFNRALTLDPEVTEARLYLVEAYQSLFEWQVLPFEQMRGLVEPQLEEVLRREPESALAHARLGVLQAQSDKLDAAEASFRRALAIDPTSVRVREAYAGVLLNYAALPTRAIEELDVARALEPMRVSRSEYSVRGRALALLNKPEAASAQFEAQMAAFPYDVGVYIDMASASQSNAEAMRSWRLCVERAPAVAACPAVVAGLYMTFGEYDEARGWLELAEARSPDSPWFWLMRFFLHQRLRDSAGMRRAAERALDFESRAFAIESLYLYSHLRWLQLVEPDRVDAYFSRHYPLLAGARPVVTPRSYAAAISFAQLRLAQGRPAEGFALLDATERVLRTAPARWFATDRLLGFDALAMLLTLRGETEAAVTRLKDLVDAGVRWNSDIVATEPVFAPLRELPAFTALLARIEQEAALNEELRIVRAMELDGAISRLSALPSAD